MAKAPAFQFYVKDWLTDTELQLSSASTRGIWSNFLCHMWSSRQRGELNLSPDQFLKFGNCTEPEMALFLKEAEALGFCYTKRQPNGDITLRNRRMYKEAKSQELNRLRQKRYYDKHKPNGKPDVKLHPLSPSPSPSPINKYSVLAEKLIEFLNEISGKKFTTKANIGYVIPRLNDGYTFEQCKSVITKKWNDPDFNQKYFCPETLFRKSKFEKYLNEDAGRKKPSKPQEETRHYKTAEQILKEKGML